MGLNERKQGVLSVHVTELPAAGADLCGEISFAELDIEEDEVTRLPSPVEFRLHLAQMQTDLLVTGSLKASVELMCDRCAEFSRHDLTAGRVCHRYENVDGEVVDLTADIREDILMAFPQTHLCSEDCRGLCPVCGQNLNEGDCGCELPDETDEFDDGAEDGGDQSENPWAALDKLTF